MSGGVDDVYRRAAAELRRGPQLVRAKPSPLLYLNEKATGRQENPVGAKNLPFPVHRPR